MFQRTVLFTLSLALLVDLCGCQTARESAVNRIGKKAAEAETAYFADPENDLVRDIEESGLDNVKWVKDKFISFVLLSNDQEKKELAGIFRAIDNLPEHETAVDKLLGFIGSDSLKDFIIRKLKENQGYSRFSDKSMDVIYASLVQIYEKKVNEKDDPEGYAQRMLKLLGKSLQISSGKEGRA